MHARIDPWVAQAAGHAVPCRAGRLHTREVQMALVEQKEATEHVVPRPDPEERARSPSPSSGGGACVRDGRRQTPASERVRACVVTRQRPQIHLCS